MQGPALGGLDVSEQWFEENDPLEVGDVIEPNGRKHVVVGITGNYQIERDEWHVVYKLEAIREPKVAGEDPPEWVENAVSEEYAYNE